MLIYKDGYFSQGNIGFAIPDGFLLETVPDMEIEDGFQLFAPDRGYAITIRIEKSYNSTEGELLDLFDNDGFHILQPPRPLHLNGMSGHCASYRAGNSSYFEARLAVDGGYGRMHAVFYVQADRAFDEVLHSDGVKRALHGIRALK